MRLVWLCSAVICTTFPVMAQEIGPEILDTFDNFALSNAVASRCVRPDGAVLQNFVPNFQQVSRSTAIYLKQRTPTATEAAVTKAMEDRYKQIDARVIAAIHEEGCDGPKVQEAVQLFRDLAKLDAAHRPKENGPHPH